MALTVSHTVLACLALHYRSTTPSLPSLPRASSPEKPQHFCLVIWGKKTRFNPLNPHSH